MLNNHGLTQRIVINQDIFHRKLKSLDLKVMYHYHHYNSLNDINSD
jgi:hypothetical protein